MEIILHPGAHRTATTSLQHYLRGNAAALGQRGVGFWGPLRLRDGLLKGVLPQPGVMALPRDLTRARGRLALQLRRSADRGLGLLIVSDENLLGTPRANLRACALYPAAGERMARLAAAFGGQTGRVVLSVRAQESYWASVLAFAVARGHPLPSARRLAALAEARRGWREVVGDIACAVPGAEIRVLPFEGFGGRPEALLARGMELAAPPRRHARSWRNRAPDLPRLRALVAERGEDPAPLGAGTGRWQPFTTEQAAALRAAYARDLAWLRAGADGLATWIEETGPDRAGPQPPAGRTTRGHGDGIEKRHLA